ncbi:polyhydroxyalkanoate synthase [Pseudoxanthobacter soli DSM 19599]|uniref:Polyhydroxyalkanoate synthase n=1 Tax=Pseudoxanthobacter soli DSM 19599 TaxID=1123029 RepID=A0A1M7Z9U6_9HYPH|nr:class I poly(R)-hydroxyalkanoic acid synthase [Pseudoxanthobacter soli]SHO61570.1 polyhydroxyalkanoate synthase [Pseudoxanthobacter soli DSM 19599]
MNERNDNPLYKYIVQDPEAFAQNLARFIEEGGKAVAAYIEPREKGEARTRVADDIAEVMKTIGQISEYWLSDPQRAVEAQARLWSGYMDLWDQSLRRMMGERSRPAAEPDQRDRRFRDPEWSENQFFDFLKQAYLITTRWADSLVEGADGLDGHTRQKAAFYIRQIANAISPSNFVLTNPELLRETVSSNGENLVRGMKMLAEDIREGKGDLKLRQTDTTKFKVGENLAVTPGKVIAENALRQLIQYSPTTETVRKRPLLIVPPWINKYYILDLNPEKSLVKWLVDQGHTVFMVSWVDPGAELAEKTFEDYMREGILASLDDIEKATGESGVDVTGYCVGGTLLAVALAHMANAGDSRIKTASFLTAQTDFSHAGDLKVFVDDRQLEILETRINERGYLDGSVMARTFNMLRSNDLLWPYVINNYMRGKEPFPFDLLFWNSDSTRMPAANHIFYMRRFYLENAFAKGQLSIDGEPLRLKKIRVPAYHLATREDHIAPAKSVFTGAAMFGGPVRMVVAGSGHIAGVCNAPVLGKYQYWTGPAPSGAFEDWIANAKEHPGSWWPDWDAWLKKHDSEMVPARVPGERVGVIEDAPGRYVMTKAA